MVEEVKQSRKRRTTLNAAPTMQPEGAWATSLSELRVSPLAIVSGLCHGTKVSNRAKPFLAEQCWTSFATHSVGESRDKPGTVQVLATMKVLRCSRLPSSLFLSFFITLSPRAVKHKKHKLTYGGQQQGSCTGGAQADDKTDSVRLRAERFCVLPHSLF